jgi:cytochrome c oxidase cbb3-type subunit 2
VEIVPLFYLKDTMEHNKHPEVMWDRQEGQSLNDWTPGTGVRPYKPMELMGREVYIREGCYLCHSQMIRPFRDEKERYGHYSLASESMYDHPFQWGSKRTGPDLARVGGKYSDDWHFRHLRAPRDVVPESVMPNYPWLENNMIDAQRTADTMSAMRTLGVPYTDADIASASSEVEGRNELQAVVAYLQVTGTMVKFDDSIDYRE